MCASQWLGTQSCRELLHPQRRARCDSSEPPAVRQQGRAGQPRGRGGELWAAACWRAAHGAPEEQQLCLHDEPQDQRRVRSEGATARLERHRLGTPRRPCRVQLLKPESQTSPRWLRHQDKAAPEGLERAAPSAEPQWPCRRRWREQPSGAVKLEREHDAGLSQELAPGPVADLPGALELAAEDAAWPPALVKSDIDPAHDLAPSAGERW